MYLKNRIFFQDKSYKISKIITFIVFWETQFFFAQIGGPFWVWDLGYYEPALLDADEMYEYIEELCWLLSESEAIMLYAGNGTGLNQIIFRNQEKNNNCHEMYKL